MAKAYGTCKICNSTKFLNNVGLCKRCNRTEESSAIKEELALKKNIHFIAKPRDNQKELSSGDAWFIKHFRRIIETLFSQLTECFHIAVVKAKTMRGLITNLYTKITAYTFGLYLSKCVQTN